MNIDFNQAFLELQADLQPVYLTCGKIEAWMLLTPIQMASKHPQAKNFSLVKRAARCGRAIQTLIAGDNEVLINTAECAWQNKRPKYSLDKFNAEMQRLKAEEINISLTKFECWCLVVAGQVAARHPDYVNSHLAEKNRQLFKQLESVIPQGVLSDYLKTGWDSNFDQPIIRKGFG